MAKVTVTIPEQRFKMYDIHFPTDWEVTFVKEPYTDEELIAAAKDAEYIFIRSTNTLTKAVVDACPKLKMIQVEGVGYEKIYLPPGETGIIVANNKGVNAVAVAEHAIGLMIAGLKRISLTDRQCKSEGFAAANANHLAQGSREINGKTIGLVGMGASATEVAKRLAPWGCKILYCNLSKVAPEYEKALNLEYMEFDDMIREVDILSFHVPSTPMTVGMLGEEQLKSMKKTALIVNVARGELADQAALARALEEGWIYGACLDLIYPEPVPADHPLLNMSPAGMDRLILSPHVAGTTNEAFTSMLIRGIENITRHMNGEEPLNIVNK